MKKIKLYGSLDNRLAENHNYLKDTNLKEGIDITKYYYSDRTCYYITKVIDQKHIFISEYIVMADRTKPGGMGHQNWVYFKTYKEANDYLVKYGLTKHYDESFKKGEIELVYRYGKWRQVIHFVFGKKLEKPKYQEFGNISFGVRNYYYDWEF